jgi:translation initiation factor IF-1
MVVEVMPHGLVRLEIVANKRKVLAHAASAKEANFVRLRPGDLVWVAIASHDPGRGRIVGVKSAGS